MFKRKIVKYLKERMSPGIIAEANRYVNISYSQEGEDLVLARFLDSSKKGFFVDVGAHHPKRFSNTYKYYLNGWQGINIDPLPGIMAEFDIHRPRDINLELGIADSECEMDYYLFNDPALNTMDPNEASIKEKIEGYNIDQVKKVHSFPLSEILDKYMPENTAIDFLTIDVEGLDLRVLQSNDWSKYRPNFLMVEELRIESKSTSEIGIFLKNLSYELVAKTRNTSIFRDRI